MNANRLEEFVQGDVTGDLSEIPGIGPKAIEALAEHEDPNEQITNTWQLIGVFLQLKGPGDVGCLEHNDKFWYWLKSRGISSHRSGIVQCIARKVNQFFPGIYDPEVYEDDDDDE